MVHEHDGEHRLRDRCGPETDARIVPTGGHDLHGVAGGVDGAAPDLDAGGGLERRVSDDVLSGGNAPEPAPRAVGEKPAPGQLVPRPPAPPCPLPPPRPPLAPPVR